MMQKAVTITLLSPSGPGSVPVDVVATGLPIPPIERIRIFSAQQWEEFILEWADSLRQDYQRVDRCAGAGDMGRDIVAICKTSDADWDNFQCKHYKDPLRPSDIWIELGKLVYYTYRGAYTYPRRYYFVAPQGAGTKLSNLFKDADRLRLELLMNWDAYCKNDITTTGEVPLDERLRAYVKSLDFSIFEAIPPLRIIDQHAMTRWHVARFGGGLPERPPFAQPPVDPAPVEALYVRQLLDAYADYLQHTVSTPFDIPYEDSLRGHFNDSRIEFYSAESLRAFSRDILPPGEFEKLQEEVHSGIADEVRADHPNGYRRVLAVVKAARSLQITAHALVSRLSVRDRGGICHQLANEERVKWVR